MPPDGEVGLGAGRVLGTRAGLPKEGINRMVCYRCGKKEGSRTKRRIEEQENEEGVGSSFYSESECQHSWMGERSHSRREGPAIEPKERPYCVYSVRSIAGKNWINHSKLVVNLALGKLCIGKS